MSRGAAIALGCCAVLAVVALLGSDRYVITGGSMGDALPAGSLAFDRDARVADLVAGDVITFRPPGMREPVTHRVIAATAAGVRTRGDANEAADPWTLGPAAEVQRVVLHVPFAGRVVSALPPAVAGLVVLLALWLTATAVADLRRGVPA